uniref:TonB box, N-terminal n=1 Tax=Medicago truncatula TaxID=3880 RepID=A2Q1K1_MEDTR|nr:TonB box, N-terminal [Medicago truncatula]
MTQCNDCNLKMTPNSKVLEANCYNSVIVKASSSGSSKNKLEFFNSLKAKLQLSILTASYPKSLFGSMVITNSNGEI